MAKVFIPQTPSRRVGGAWVSKYDLSPAEAFGRLVHLNPPGMLTQKSLLRVLPMFRDGLRDFGPDDSIMAVGDPIAISVAVYYAAQGHLSDGTVHILRFDRHAKAYKRLAVKL